LPYYLNEATDWSIDMVELETLVTESIKANIIPKCIIVSNPGNPTGSVIPKESIEELILFASKYNLVIIADEIY